MRVPKSVSVALGSALLAAGCTAQIAQPSVEDLPIAPEGERIDLAMPSFSNPTDVDNPLFPVSRQASLVMLGTVDDLPFRTEVTLLPRTRVIEWEGKLVETLVSQYAAFSDGRINELAYDYYAQADDGSVWYFGEDVFNFADGAIADTHGTWMAGLGGPACMIMPANPEVGDVYRPENMPGVVFEEVTVKSVDQPLDGPLGPIEGGILVEELHMDGATEDKTFAPDYGEFFTSDGTDTEALALAVPTDAAEAPLPEQLTALVETAYAVEEMAEAGDWASASSSSDAMRHDWEEYAAGDVPVLFAPVMSEALDRLSEGIGAEDSVAAIQAALDVARLAIDLQLRYRPPSEVDVARLGVWSRQLMLDAGEEDPGSVRGDLFAIDYVRDRDLGLEPADATRLNYLLEEMHNLMAEDDLPGVAEAADVLEDFVTDVEGG